MELVLDEPKEQDTHLIIDEQLFLFDPFTVETFDEPITLSFSDTQGFKLSSSSEIIAYGLRLR